MALSKDQATLALAVVSAFFLFTLIKPNKSESYKSCGCSA